MRIMEGFVEESHQLFFFFLLFLKFQFSYTNTKGFKKMSEIPTFKP